MPEIVAALLREIAWPFALVLAWVAGELGQAVVAMEGPVVV